MERPSQKLILITLALACCLAACGRVGSASASAEVDSVAFTTNSQEPDTAATVTIAMTGDVMLGTEYPERKLPPDGGAHLLTDAAPILSAANVAVGNLEGVFAFEMPAREKPSKQLKAFFFCMPPSMAPLLRDAGYDFMSMANNHTYDFMTPGEASTRRVLDSVGISYAGTPNCKSAIRSIGGVTYGFAAFGHNSGTMLMRDTASVSRIVSDLKAKADVVIVSFHGGAEGGQASHLPNGTEYYAGENRGDLRSFAHRAIDCGAAVVFGHGPHVVRALELYRGHLIAYSLGNFCTPCGVSVAGKCGYAPLLTATVTVADGRFVAGRIHSMIQRWGVGPRLDPDHKAVAEMASLTQTDIPQRSQPKIASDGTLSLPQW